MKNNKFIYRVALLLFIGLSAALLNSCGDDDLTPDLTGEFGTADYTALQAKITEVETYLTTAVEGVNQGNHPPGAIGDFSPIVDNVKQIISKGLNQKITDRSLERLTAEFDAFRANVVSPANPYIQRDNNNSIVISDAEDGGTPGQLMDLFDAGNPFTIELDLFPASIQQTGFSNALISTASIGPNNGFVVRYFGDGRFEFIVGNNNPAAWQETASGGGLIAASKWSTVSFVYDGALSFKLFLDGDEILSQDVESYVNSDVDGELLDIGNLVGFGRPIDGLVKNVKVWTKALSPVEMGVDVDGSEEGLNVYFPFDANLGKSFNDVSGKYTADLAENVLWIPGGNLGEIVVDYSELQALITEATDIIDNATEGTEDGDFPPNTKSTLQEAIDAAQPLIDDEAGQLDVDGVVVGLSKLIDDVKLYVVGPADGIFIDGFDNSAVGMRVTPPKVPEGDFSVLLDVKVDDFTATGGEADMAASGAWVVRYLATTGPDDTDEGRIKNAGRVQFYLFNGGWNIASTPFSVIIPGKWINVAVTYNAATMTQSIYIDGHLAGSLTGSGPAADFGWGEIWLGNGYTKMNGNLRNFQFWNKALSEAEVMNFMNRDNVVGDEADLEVYMPLDRVLGLNHSDATGTRNGELRGAAWNIQ